MREQSKRYEIPYNSKYGYITNVKNSFKYNYEDVVRAESDANEQNMRKISIYFYKTNTSYRRIIDYFATLFRYYYVLDLKNASKASNKIDVERLYRNTLSALDGINVKDTFSNITRTVLTEGVFYGYVTDFDQFHHTITSLHPDYCRSMNMSPYGTKILEFNIQYFLKYCDETDLETTLKAFPLEIQIAYNDYYVLNSRTNPWVALSPERSCVFYLSEDKLPPLFSSLVDILNFKEYKDIEKERDTQELEKLLVQRLGLDEQSDLEAYLEELTVMHNAVSEMMADKKNIDVLTSIADSIELLDTKSSVNASQDNIKKMILPKYEGAGLSYELFASSGASSLEKNIQNSTSFIEQLIEQYSIWLSMWCYSIFRFEKIVPIVTILPITIFNEKDKVEQYLKGAQYGYSWILPYVASGKKQSTLIDAIYLEQDILDLSSKMRPLSSSFTQSDDAGRPKLSDDEKTEKTVANIDANQ